MKHAGTLTLRPGSFLARAVRFDRQHVRAGFENILVLNGHGGNVAPCQAIWNQFLQATEVNLHFLPYWDTIQDDAARDLLETRSIPGHAQEFETAFALAAFPENVDTRAVADQPDPSPRRRPPRRGRHCCILIVERVTAYLEEMIAGKRVARFHRFIREEDVRDRTAEAPTRPRIDRRGSVWWPARLTVAVRMMWRQRVTFGRRP